MHIPVLFAIHMKCADIQQNMDVSCIYSLGICIEDIFSTYFISMLKNHSENVSQDLINEKYMQNSRIAFDFLCSNFVTNVMQTETRQRCKHYFSIFIDSYFKDHVICRNEAFLIFQELWEMRKIDQSDIENDILAIQNMFYLAYKDIINVVYKHGFYEHLNDFDVYRYSLIVNVYNTSNKNKDIQTNEKRFYINPYRNTLKQLKFNENCHVVFANSLYKLFLDISKSNHNNTTIIIQSNLSFTLSAYLKNKISKYATNQDSKIFIVKDRTSKFYAHIFDFFHNYFIPQLETPFLLKFLQLELKPYITQIIFENKKFIRENMLVKNFFLGEGCNIENVEKNILILNGCHKIMMFIVFYYIYEMITTKKTELHNSVNLLRNLSKDSFIYFSRECSEILFEGDFEKIASTIIFKLKDIFDRQNSNKTFGYQQILIIRNAGIGFF